MQIENNFGGNINKDFFNESKILMFQILAHQMKTILGFGGNSLNKCEFGFKKNVNSGNGQ